MQTTSILISRKDDFHTELQESNEPLFINVKKATKIQNPLNKRIGLYPMLSSPRGLVLIIANNLYELDKDKRPSAKHDGANLQKLFEDMGFEVTIHYDLTGGVILQFYDIKYYYLTCICKL